MTNKLYKPLLIDSVKASVDLPKQRFVDFEGSICTAGKKAYGVCDASTDSEQFAPIGVFGVFLIETGGAITIGAEVTSDNEGKAVVATASDKVNGYALDDGAVGEVIRIVRGI